MKRTDIQTQEEENWTNMVRVDKEGSGIVMVKESHNQTVDESGFIHLSIQKPANFLFLKFEILK